MNKKTPNKNCLKTVQISKKNIETDIQIAIINILHEQGVVSDKLHSVTVDKIIKGV